MPADVKGMPGAERLQGMSPRETDLASRQLRSWSERIKAQSVFSARTTERSYVDMIKRRLVEVATRSEIPLVAERNLRAALGQLGYTPERGFPDNNGRVPPARPGSITDLSSSRRIQLIVDTNIKQARSLGQIAASDDPVFLMAHPAWRLERTGARKKPRGDWKRRWADAGAACGWRGAAKTEMAALKTSPIWEELGRGAGNHRDAVGSPYPPFAFGSGMAWTNVRRSEWKALCAKEGIPDGLDEIRERARQLKRGQEATGGPGAYGASAAGPIGGVLAHLGTGTQTQWAQEHPHYVQQELPFYAADTASRDSAANALRDAAKSIETIRSEIAAAAREIGDAERGVIGLAAQCGQGILEPEAAYIARRLENAKSADRPCLDALARLRSELASTASKPLPSDAAAQRAYDVAMRRLAGLADALVRNVRRIAKAVLRDADDAKKALSAAERKVLQWKRRRCDEILREAADELKRLAAPARIAAMSAEVAKAESEWVKAGGVI